MGPHECDGRSGAGLLSLRTSLSVGRRGQWRVPAGPDARPVMRHPRPRFVPLAPRSRAGNSVNRPKAVVGVRHRCLAHELGEITRSAHQRNPDASPGQDRPQQARRETAAEHCDVVRRVSSGIGITHAPKPGQAAWNLSRTPAERLRGALSSRVRGPFRTGRAAWSHTLCPAVQRNDRLRNGISVHRHRHRYRCRRGRGMPVSRRRVGSRRAVGLLKDTTDVVTEVPPDRWDVDIFGVGNLVNGYLQSKWAAERLIRHARARGIAVDVHRPGSRTPNRPSRPQADLRRSTTRQWCDPVRALYSWAGGGVRDARQTTAVQRGRPHRDQLPVERRPQPRSGCPPGTGPLAGEGVPPERLPVPGHRAAVRGRGTGPGASGSSTPSARRWATAIVRPRIRPG